MKTCPNCRVVHADEYNGQCQECGAPLGNVRGSNQGDLAFRFARQVQRGAEESSQEQAMKRGRYDRVKVEDGLMEVSKAAAYLLERSAGRGEDWDA